MRKLKLFFATLALVVGVSSVNAYTTSDLTSAGWAQVTTSSIANTGDNYYMLVDANSSGYVMSNEADHYRPCYKTIADPVANPSFVWILEGSDNTFALKSYSTGAYFVHTSNTWDTSVNGASGTTTFVFTLNEGKYSIKGATHSGLVGHWNDNGAAVANDGENIAANKATSNAPGFYLYAISKSTFDATLSASRLAAAASATKTSPVDVTSYIQNADWSGDWGGWARSGSWGNQQWGQKTLESWNATNVIVKQELQGVPNGQYKLTADLISGPGATKAAFVFATGDAKVSSDVVSDEASADNYTTMSNEVAGKTLTADNVNVTGNTITVGFDQSTGWIVADNFKLYYYGPNLAASAPLPVGSDMVADTWYYFDIAIAGKYNLECTTLSDIVYSTDASILVEDAASITTTFASTPLDLAAGRYYVKSSSAQTLTVAAASYSYSVGTATSSISGTYLQALTSVTFAFADAASNDPGATFGILDGTAVASLKKGGSEVATGTLSLASTTLTATFTGVTLDMASTYTIEIPAGVVGYSGQDENAAVSVDFNTPAVADGVYYMYNTDTKNYISRAGNYNTQAVMDNWGLAFKVSTDASNNTQLQYFDSYLWLGDDGFCYGDCNDTRRRFFNVTKVEGGYKFLNTNNNHYLAVNSGVAVGDAVEGDNLQGTSNIWALESTTAHVANYTKNEDAQAASAASAASLTGITTKAGLESELASNYGETGITVTGAKAEKFQEYPGNGQDSGPVTYYSETISDLKPGIYKLSVDAFQRAAGNDRVSLADGARGIIYLYAGQAKTQLKSVMEYGAASAYSGDYEYNGKHYPDTESAAYDALATGNYKNDVYVYVADAGEGTGSLEIGIKNPSRPGGNFGTWAVYNNFTLTRYDAKATIAEKEALNNAIEAAEAKTLGFETGEYAPYENVAALKALAAAKAIDIDIASGEAVVAATTALTGVTWTANAAEVNAFYDGTFSIQPEHTTGPTALAGWNTPEGIRQLIKNTETDPGLNSATDKAAVFAWGNTTLTYGNTEGYTMPLAAHTIYELTFKTCGWRDGDMGYVNVTVLNDNNEGMIQQSSATATKRIGEENPWNEFKIVFATGDAGNYKFGMWTSKHTVFTDLVLKKAASQVLEFADNAELPKYAPGTYPTVKISRTLTANRWATAVYPFAVEKSSDLAIATLDSYDAGKLAFKTLDASMANEPFLMRSTAGATEINLSNVSVVATAATDVVKGDASLKGTYTKTTVDAGTDVYNYVLSNNTIYKVGSNAATISPYRAYIQLTQPAPARLSFSIDGEDTQSIEGISVAESENGMVYNLQGQRVMNAQKGLFIQNGKKIVIK